MDQEKACRRELATLFAHIIYESGSPTSGDETSFYSGLSRLTERGCSDTDPNVSVANCAYQMGISNPFNFIFPQ